MADSAPPRASMTRVESNVGIQLKARKRQTGREITRGREGYTMHGNMVLCLTVEERCVDKLDGFTVVLLRCMRFLL